MIELALGHADAARLRVLRWFGPWARPLFVSREVRVAWTGALLVTAALALTRLVPLWMLALGPLVWGVPHVVADLRYLALRPGYHRRPTLVVPVLLALACGWAGFGVRAALFGGALCALVTRAPIVRRLAVAAPLAGLGLLAHLWEAIATIVFAHAHNVVAILFFAFWRRRGSRLHWIPVGVVAAGAIAILGGAFDGALRHASSFAGLHFGDLVAQLAPAEIVSKVSTDPVMPDRVVLLFAFAQSVHYVVWLRLVPEEERAASSPVSFRQSFRSLVRDVGVPLLAIHAVAAVVFVVWAFGDLPTARIRYLQIAFFHGWLEILAAAIMLAEGRPQRT
ncbi:MAG: hypothetical protein KF819_06350 [Labilithrix sp.]|nr:hypothetical protein [Labilithrix sp.]